MNDLIIYGCGGVGRMIEQIVFDINSTDEQWNVLGFIDDNGARHGETVAGYPVIGGVEILKQLDKAYVALGFSNPGQKESAAGRLAKAGVDHIATLLHPRAWISRRVEIGRGSIIYPGVHIDVDVTIGQYVLLNKLCTIGHDTVIGDYVTAAPGAKLGGNCVFGDGAELGINCSTLQGLSIGKWSMIGGGAVVLGDVDEKHVVAGVPARPIKEVDD